MHDIKYSKLNFGHFSHSRDGSDWMFTTLSEHNVPLLIFSAGIGDIIEECLRQHHDMYRNMEIISNWMKFDREVWKDIIWYQYFD